MLTSVTATPPPSHMTRVKATDWEIEAGEAGLTPGVQHNCVWVRYLTVQPSESKKVHHERGQGPLTQIGRGLRCHPGPGGSYSIWGITPDTLPPALPIPRALSVLTATHVMVTFMVQGSTLKTMAPAKSKRKLAINKKRGKKATDPECVVCSRVGRAAEEARASAVRRGRQVMDRGAGEPPQELCHHWEMKTSQKLAQILRSFGCGNMPLEILYQIWKRLCYARAVNFWARIFPVLVSYIRTQWTRPPGQFHFYQTSYSAQVKGRIH